MSFVGSWKRSVTFLLTIITALNAINIAGRKVPEQQTSQYDPLEYHDALLTHQSGQQHVFPETHRPDHDSGISNCSLSRKAHCTPLTLEVPVKAVNIEFDFVEFANQAEVTAFLQQFSYRNNTSVLNSVIGSIEIEKTYRVYAELCVPVPISGSETHVRTLQILTHGSTLDHTYWDMSAGNSYVDAAAEAGYATLNYDRVGTGLSDHPDPIREVQTSVHIEVIHALAQMSRQGKIQNWSFESVIGVGHSTGSWYTHAAASKYPEDLDAVVMTGVSTYSGSAVTSFASCAFQLANLDPSGKFASLSNGYLSAAPMSSIHQFNFYHFPHYEDSVLKSQFAARQTMAIGDLLTLFQPLVVSDYTGPLDVVNGEHDFVTCGGDCTADGIDVVAQVQPVFAPNAVPGSRSFLVSNSGHNINGHHAAKEAFEHIFDFLRGNKLV